MSRRNTRTLDEHGYAYCGVCGRKFFLEFLHDQCELCGKWFCEDCAREAPYPVGGIVCKNCYDELIEKYGE